MVANDRGNGEDKSSAIKPGLPHLRTQRSSILHRAECTVTNETKSLGVRTGTLGPQSHLATKQPLRIGLGSTHHIQTVHIMMVLIDAHYDILH